MNVVVDELIVNYQTIGNGPKSILFIHGWGDSIDSFSKMASSLSEFYKVILVDLPGFGGSQTPKQTWGLSEYANFINSFLNKVSVVPDIIVGHSNGMSSAISRPACRPGMRPIAPCVKSAAPSSLSP